VRNDWYGSFIKPEGNHYENPYQPPERTTNTDSDSQRERPILPKCLEWEKTLWFSQIRTLSQEPPFPKIVETRPKIADPRSANLSKTALSPERFVPIDGVLDRYYKSFTEKNRKEP
jgi:hypothetical protein